MLNVTFNSIYTNDPTLADEIRKYIKEIAPEKSKIIKLYKGSIPIFDHFGINKQIKALFGKTVSFKHGAYLIIDHTEVKTEYSGKGIGKQLVMAAVEFARSRNVKILPLCPFAKAIFGKIPEIRDVL